MFKVRVTLKPLLGSALLASKIEYVKSGDAHLGVDIPLGPHHIGIATWKKYPQGNLGIQWSNWLSACNKEVLTPACRYFPWLAIRRC